MVLGFLELGVMLDSVRYGVKGVNYDQNYDHLLSLGKKNPSLGKIFKRCAAWSMRQGMDLPEQKREDSGSNNF